jgi:hypothetical protein
VPRTSPNSIVNCHGRVKEEDQQRNLSPQKNSMQKKERARTPGKKRLQGLLGIKKRGSTLETDLSSLANGEREVENYDT